MEKKEEKKCCVCGVTKNLYSVTPDKEVNGEYVIEIYCEKHLWKEENRLSN